MIDTMPQYTENQTALLASVDLHEGADFDKIAVEAAREGIVRDRKTARNVLTQLVRKGVLTINTRYEDGSAWVALKVEEPWFAGHEEPEDLLGVEKPDLDLLGLAERPVSIHTEMAVVKEWADGDGTEWTETTFPDGSRTLKRRRLVSGAWRTDYWGAENASERARATTARLARMAKSAGHFAHTV